MQKVKSNGIEICYYDHAPKQASANAPTLLMIHGLGLPAIAWPQSLIDLFTGAGYRVITFDNRDMGRSTVLDDAPRFKLTTEFFRSKFGFKFRTAYTLDDMKDDALGLLDALDIQKVHVVGLSMGGMIAQLLACHHSDRVISLTSIMSTTGYKKLKQTDKALRNHLMKGSPSEDFAVRLSYNLKTWQMIASPDYRASEAEMTAFVSANLEYGIPIYGVGRQTMAIMSAPDRRGLLQKLDMPALVIHGADDILLPVECGIDTADHIKNARLEIIKGMGHDMPEALMPVWFKMITEMIDQTQNS